MQQNYLDNTNVQKQWQHNIVSMMKSDAEHTRYEERVYLIKVMECVQFLARQNIPFQGSHDGNGNFNQLLLFHLKGSKQKKRLLLPKKYQQKKYMHADYQNE